MDALNELSYSVQMKYEKAEKTWEDHGDVSLLTADGTELAKQEKFQHNRGWGSWQDLKNNAEKLAKQAVAEFVKVAKKEEAPKEEAPKEDEVAKKKVAKDEDDKKEATE